MVRGSALLAEFAGELKGAPSFGGAFCPLVFIVVHSEPNKNPTNVVFGNLLTTRITRRDCFQRHPCEYFRSLVSVAK